jgi:hypothetical protein
MKEMRGRMCEREVGSHWKQGEIASTKGSSRKNFVRPILSRKSSVGYTTTSNRVVILVGFDGQISVVSFISIPVERWSDCE